MSRFRLPPGGHHRGDRAAPHGREASPRERHGGAPQPPAAAAASSRQRPGLGGGDEEGTSEDEVGGQGSPKFKNGCSGTPRPGLPFLPPGAFYSGGPRCCSPRLGSTPLPTPLPPPLAPGPAATAAAAALPAREAA